MVRRHRQRGASILSTEGRRSGASLRSPAQELGGGGDGAPDLGRRRLLFTRITRDGGFLSDLWGRGVSSRGNDVGWAGLPPVQMHPNGMADLPGPTQPEVLWPGEIAGIPGGSLATKQGLIVLLPSS